MKTQELTVEVRASSEELAQATFCSFVVSGWSFYSSALIAAASNHRKLASLSHEQRMELAQAAFHYVASTIPATNPFRLAIERYAREQVPTAPELTAPPPVCLLSPSSEATVEAVRPAT